MSTVKKFHVTEFASDPVPSEILINEHLARIGVSASNVISIQRDDLGLMRGYEVWYHCAEAKEVTPSTSANIRKTARKARPKSAKR